ncbi:MAG: aminoacyl-tRNA hydrolase [Candidatus Marinimicrobia bacterium]|nr:aminoacyl-tRNA hydrolase [Candidatus Neomarinimicrobiota bacterium]
MIAFVGLGNPGSQYAKTKHNAGFWVVDELARRWKVKFKPGKGDYVYTETRQGRVLLVKPTTGMNVCGPAVRAILARWQIELQDLFVIVDDVDLPLGTLRLRPKGGDGCHRGMESIIYQLGSMDFPRLRFGIATDEEIRPAEKFVLLPFRPRDEKLAQNMISAAADEAESIMIRGLQKTMAHFNRNTNQGDAQA